MGNKAYLRKPTDEEWNSIFFIQRDLCSVYLKDIPDDEKLKENDEILIKHRKFLDQFDICIYFSKICKEEIRSFESAKINLDWYSYYYKDQKNEKMNKNDEEERILFLKSTCKIDFSIVDKGNCLSMFKILI